MRPMRLKLASLGDVPKGVEIGFNRLFECRQIDLDHILGVNIVSKQQFLNRVQAKVQWSINSRCRLYGKAGSKNTLH